MSDFKCLERDFMTKFIETYRDSQCLWKVKSRDYHNKSLKDAATLKLVRLLRQVEKKADANTVKRKINSMRSSYRKEKVKIRRSIEAGNVGKKVYVPQLWYFQLLSFIDTQYEPGEFDVPKIPANSCLFETDNKNRTTVIKNTSIFIERNEAVQRSNVPSNTLLSNMFPTDDDKIMPSIESISIFPVNIESICDTGIYIEDTMNEKTKNSLEDHCDAIGKKICAMLKRVPKNMKSFAEKLVNEILIDAQSGILNEDSTLITPQNHYR